MCKASPRARSAPPGESDGRDGHLEEEVSRLCEAIGLCSAEDSRPGFRAQIKPLRRVASSKASDNERTTTALGHSEILSVQRSVGEPIPEFSQRPEEGTKVRPFPQATTAALSRAAR